MHPSDGRISNLAFYADGALLRSTANTSLSLTWSNVAAGVHSIWVDATDNLGVTTESNLTVYVRPLNDYFANRISISGSSATVTGTTDGASKEPDEPNHAGYPGGTSVWWSWTSTFNGYVTISADMVNRNYYYNDYFGVPLLAVYTGTSVSSLDSIASSAPADLVPNHAQVSFVATAGVTYQIAVDSEHNDPSYWGNGTTVTLRLIPTQPPLVSITSPMDGAMFTGPTNITITADATDPDGTIRRVDFYNSSTAIGSTTNYPYKMVLSNLRTRNLGRII
jgi:hypothetical protein